MADGLSGSASQANAAYKKSFRFKAMQAICSFIEHCTLALWAEVPMHKGRICFWARRIVESGVNKYLINAAKMKV
jgi:hypothetical protein